MNRRSYRAAALLLAACCACGPEQGEAAPEAEEQASSSAVWQLSPLAMFARGGYQGVLTTTQVAQQGNQGIGAADSLDGEMLLLDGRFYQFRPGGTVVAPRPGLRMPFAAVTTWTQGEGRRLQVAQGLEYQTTFVPAIDAQLATRNAFYAVRMTGTFARVEARTYLKETPPFRPLRCVGESKYVMENVAGTMVGFIQPSYADSLSIPNYHLHFVTRDGRMGGHVLNFVTGTDTMFVSVRADFTVRMPPPVAAPPTGECPTTAAAPAPES